MRVEFELKYRDLLLYNMAHMFLSPIVQAFSLMLPVLLVVFSEDGKRDLDTMTAAAMLYPLIWVAQLVFMAIYLLAMDNKTVLTRRVIELHDNALFEETRFASSHFYWQGIRKIVRRPGFIAVYVSGLAAHVIPNRAFVNKTERERFWTALHQRRASAA